ncbi:ATP synthase F1 subunit delta [Helicobacter aurati]|uniref:ATP synthase subunit delta n=1 Tax=Helicobacter aurati TaxID=137778 RepID=A0A3D8J896_9HELI|nr:F0F1 ATP synthase subunit delta [Helicobacter aurati]RDU73652.1 ATP synthase F1 subunit delta [Helicobacter aurati]
MQEIIIAKKYARALAACSNIEQLTEIYNVYSSLESAFTLYRFYEIINSPIVSKEDKLNLLYSLIHSLNQKLDSKSQRFLAVLAENSRLSLIPAISTELKKIIDYKRNIYLATLYSNEQISNDTLQKIKTNLEKKLHVSLEIFQEIDFHIDGIRLNVPDLGIEIVFLKNNFIKELQDFILKAF